MGELWFHYKEVGECSVASSMASVLELNGVETSAFEVSPGQAIQQAIIEVTDADFYTNCGPFTYSLSPSDNPVVNINHASGYVGIHATDAS